MGASTAFITTCVVGCTLSIIWLAAWVFNHRRVVDADQSGEPDEGIVVFVEPVRWLFIVWGFPWLCDGLRRAGYRGAIQLFRWSSTAGALAVIPDLVWRSRLDRRAARLARRLDRLARAHPEKNICVIGYSSGAYVATEACKRLTQTTAIRRLILLAPSVSPRYDWGELVHREIRMHSFYSRMDAINVLGPLLFGSNDRRWGPAAGAAGFDRPPANLTQRVWEVTDVNAGYFGDHFTIASPAFVARHVAPLLAHDKRNAS